MFNDTGHKTFTAGAAMGERLLVIVSSGVLALAGATDANVVGATTRPAFASGDKIDVALVTKQGTVELVAAGAITAGATVYQAASGKVASTGTVVVGIALTGATAANDVIEVMYLANKQTASLARASLVEDALAPYALPLNDARVHDAPNSLLPTSASSDDLGMIGGTFGTTAPTLQSVDFKNTTTTAYARLFFAVPQELLGGAQDLKLRINAGALTTVASSAMTVDVQCFRQAAPSTDICATAAQSINNLTAADKDFVLTATNVVPGDVLDIRITIAGTDSATGTAVIAKINSVAVLADIKG